VVKVVEELPVAAGLGKMSLKRGLAARGGLGTAPPRRRRWGAGFGRCATSERWLAPDRAARRHPTRQATRCHAYVMA